MVLLVGVALGAALIARHSRGRAQLRTLALIGGLALGLRLIAIAAIWIIATPPIGVHPEGVWLNDEASYFLATEALMPWPWDHTLPLGLDHLAGNGYLGLTTFISEAVGRVDSLAFRDANAIFGTIVVVLCAWLGHSFFGRTAGVLAGVAAAVWPDLILWSATMLRDTLGSLAVVGVWWALRSYTRTNRLVMACFVVLALVLLATLRTYLAVTVGVGVMAWLIYPVVRRQQARTLLSAALGVVVVAGALSLTQLRRLDEAQHELFYRQTVTRMETLGRLYRDPPPADQPMQLPFRPGAAIAIPDPNTGWLLAGLVEDSATPGFVDVSLTDDTSRTVPIADVVLLQSANIPFLEPFSMVLPSALSVFAGWPTTREEPNPAWIAAALAWDALLVAGVLGLARRRLPMRDALYPLCVVLGTVAALTALPGAPGNAERHRATQTVPLLLVFASGIVAARGRRPALEPLARIDGRNMSARPTPAVPAGRRAFVLSLVGLLAAACARSTPRPAPAIVATPPDLDRWTQEALGMLSDVLQSLRTFDTYQAFRVSTAAQSGMRLATELAWDPPTSAAWDEATHVARGLSGRAEQLFQTVTTAKIDPNLWREQRARAAATHNLLDLGDMLTAYRDRVDRLAPGDAADALSLLDKAWAQWDAAAASWQVSRAEAIACVTGKGHPVLAHCKRLLPGAALAVTGALLLYAHLAVAALSVCGNVNEAPAFGIGFQDIVPSSAASARAVLPLVRPFGVADPTPAQTCTPAAPALAMTVAGIAYLTGVLLLYRAAPPHLAHWVFVGAIAVAIDLTLFMPGLLSSDILDYTSHGRVAAIHGANPYLLTPADFPSDPFATQGAWPNVVTVYGPLWTRIDVALTGLLAAASSAQIALAYKMLGLASYLLSTWLVWWIAGQWRALQVTEVPRIVAVALWSWNPVVTIELVGSAHNEGVMTVLVLAGFAFLTLAVRRGQAALWLASLTWFTLGALIKFVPAAIAAIVALVWLRRAPTPARVLRRALVLGTLLVLVAVVVAWPWLNSPAVLGPLVSLASGGQRFKNAWQDAPAAWLAVRVLPAFGVPDVPDTHRMDVARTIVWGVTRAVFIAYVAIEGVWLWRRANDDAPGVLLKTIATASVRVLLLAILLFVSQVYAWYFLWPLPAACLLGLRDVWSRAAVVFGLTFLVAFYLREFQPYGVFYVPLYGLASLGVVGLTLLWGRAPLNLLLALIGGIGIWLAIALPPLIDSQRLAALVGLLSGLVLYALLFGASSLWLRLRAHSRF